MKTSPWVYMFLLLVLSAICLTGYYAYQAGCNAGTTKFNEASYDIGYEEGISAGIEIAKDEIRHKLSGEDPDFIEYLLEW